jgi:hypothetical protein
LNNAKYEKENLNNNIKYDDSEEILNTEGEDEDPKNLTCFS